MAGVPVFIKSKTVRIASSSFGINCTKLSMANVFTMELRSVKYNCKREIAFTIAGGQVEAGQHLSHMPAYGSRSGLLH